MAARHDLGIVLYFFKKKSMLILIMIHSWYLLIHLVPRLTRRKVASQKLY